MASLLHSAVLLALLSLVHAVAIYKGTPPKTSAEHGGVHQDPEVNMNAVSNTGLPASLWLNPKYYVQNPKIHTQVYFTVHTLTENTSV